MMRTIPRRILCCFKFAAAGTTMSILFRNPHRYRKDFVELLERNHGVSGMLDSEEGGGQLFWFRGKVYDVEMYAYYKPDEIKSILRSKNLGV